MGLAQSLSRAGAQSIILYVITSVLTVAWLAWTGTLLWMETAPHGATRRVGAREGHLVRS